MDREPSEARFCGECNRFHSAEEGDLWAESSMLGLRITYFAFMDGKVYDITGELDGRRWLPLELNEINDSVVFELNIADSGAQCIASQPCSLFYRVGRLPKDWHFA